ncbi:hypothetical protein CDD83_10485 [Cordyceps sp. RAO-2017]|nr:hypothetical protein CDD83_10485 [Cordyceps sp. RAO-2017]
MRPPSSSPPRHRDDGGDDSNRDDFSLTRPPQHDAQSSPRLLLSAVAAAASPTRLPPSRQPPPQHHAHYQSPSSSSSSSSPSPPPPAPTLPLQGPPPPAAAIVGLARHDADTHAHSFDASLPLSDSAPACPPDSRTRRRPRSGPPPSATRPSSGTQELSPSVDQAEFDPDPEPAAAADDADGDDGRPSGGNPAHHHLQSLSVSSDHDLLMSDSDGGAPLADLAVATSFFSSIDLGLNPDSDGVAADPQDSDSDSDADPDHNNAQASAANAPADSSNSSSHHAYTLSQPGHLAEIHAYHASLLHLVMADAPPPPPPWANNSQPPPLVQAGNAPPAFAPQLPFFDAFDAFPPVQMSNPNPTILGSENLGLVDFLRNWAYQACFGSAPGLRPPLLPEVHSQARAEVKDVTYADLAGDARDFQALDWSAMATTREAARARRLGTYKNYVNHLRSDESTDDVRIPSSDSFFRFRKMTFRPDISLAHFQLRSVLACPTRTEAYYSCRPSAAPSRPSTPPTAS